MKISYNWLKWYIPQVPEPQKLADIFTYHLAEVEGVEEKDGDTIFDINILPNRAHDLLSHQGIAREISSLLGIDFVDPAPKYKVPASKPTGLKINIETDKCRRYMGRIVRNVKVEPSPEWVVKHLESIGQRSINNIVDAANIVMYDCGQPTHAFDLEKLSGEKIIIRQALFGEKMITLDDKGVELKENDMVIADDEKILAIAGVKGGKDSGVSAETKDIVLEVANFDPTSVRKTAQSINLFTDARKRFENDLSPELAPFAMLEFSALIKEVCPEAEFEEAVDVYQQKQKERTLSFFTERISGILGTSISEKEIEDILKRYNFEYSGNFEIKVPALRLDLEIEEDIAEEVGRILGYDKVKPVLPKINFTPKKNETHEKIQSARSFLLAEGYSEVMSYTFANKGEREVLESASDKKFLRTNLSDGLKESVKLNQLNAPFLGVSNAKVFEIGTVFLKDSEEIRVAYGDKKGIKEENLEEFCRNMPESFSSDPRISSSSLFKMWSLYPFISRDVAVWIPEGEGSDKLHALLKENGTELLVKDPQMFDSFTKDGRTSYAFRLIFQSYERTLTDDEVNKIMANIESKIRQNKDWQIR